MKRYVNNSGTVYTGGSVRIHGKRVFNPTEDDIIAAGYKAEEINDSIDIISIGKNTRMSEIQKELASMDYLTSKYIDGEDMSKYGDWQAKRRQLREEYRQLEEEIQ